MKVLFLVILLLIQNEINCQNMHCVEHPALDGLQRIVLQQKKYDQTLFEKLSSILTKFEDKTAKKASTDLGICSQYNGQQTCCDSELIGLLKDLAYSKYLELKSQKTFFSQVLSNIGLSINKCGARNEDQENDVENIDTGIKDVEIFKSKYKQCMVKTIKSVVRFYRGQVCSICAGLEKISTYFTGTSTPLLEENNFNQYYNDMMESMTCMNSLREELPEIVNTLFSELSDQSDECEQIKKTYQKMLTDNLNFPCQGKTCEDSCSNLYFLGSHQNCEVNSFVSNNIQEQLKQILNQGYFSRISQSSSSNSKSSNQKRQLINIKQSNFFFSKSGINSYLIDSELDDQVIIDGADYQYSIIVHFGFVKLLILLMFIMN